MSARDLALAIEDYETARNLDWMRYANCRGTDVNLWFPDAGQSAAGRAERRRVCGACGVIADCEAYARAQRPIGCWAMTNTKDRSSGPAAAALHGSESRYRSGCRCAPCVEAHREGVRRWRNRTVRK